LSTCEKFDKLSTGLAGKRSRRRLANNDLKSWVVHLCILRTLIPFQISFCLVNHQKNLEHFCHKIYFQEFYFFINNWKTNNR
jgi:hypothetical protein